MKISSLMTAGLVTVGGFAFAKPQIQGTIPVQGKSRTEYAPLAKVTLQQAIAKAMLNTKGKVIEAALDNEDGFLVYEIEVLMPDQKLNEILIDAGDGKVLLTKDVTKDKDRESEQDDKD